MSDSSSIDRRNFLLQKSGQAGRVIELSCEQLWMRYLDARLAGAERLLFERLSRDLQNADELRLTGAYWLEREEMKVLLDPVLEAFRKRGGKVVVT